MKSDTEIINDKHDKNEQNDVSHTSESKGKFKNFRKRLWLFFVKNYLPIALIFAVTFGALVPQPGVFFNHKITVYICVAILFFYVGLYLQTSAIKDAIKSYKGYIWAILSILVVTSVIGGQLTNLLDFGELKTKEMSFTNGTVRNSTKSESVASNKDETLGPFESKVGLIMYNIMPCTVGSGVVMVINSFMTHFL